MYTKYDQSLHCFCTSEVDDLGSHGSTGLDDLFKLVNPAEPLHYGEGRGPSGMDGAGCKRAGSSSLQATPMRPRSKKR